MEGFPSGATFHGTNFQGTGNVDEAEEKLRTMLKSIRSMEYSRQVQGVEGLRRLLESNVSLKLIVDFHIVPCLVFFLQADSPLELRQVAKDTLHRVIQKHPQTDDMSAVVDVEMIKSLIDCLDSKSLYLTQTAARLLSFITSNDKEFSLMMLRIGIVESLLNVSCVLPAEGDFSCFVELTKNLGFMQASGQGKRDFLAALLELLCYLRDVEDPEVSPRLLPRVLPLIQSILPSKDIKELRCCLTLLRHLLEDCVPQRTLFVLKSDLLPHLLQLMVHPDRKVAFKAVSCFSSIASGGTEHCQVLFSHGVLNAIEECRQRCTDQNMLHELEKLLLLLNGVEASTASRVLQEDITGEGGWMGRGI